MLIGADCDADTPLTGLVVDEYRRARERTAAEARAATQAEGGTA